ncbi:MAG: hypothetical protein WKG07_33705 [Hymenobacter sp.]
MLSIPFRANSQPRRQHLPPSTCCPTTFPTTILTVGDPGRVAQVSRHFDSMEFETAHREFVTHVGYYRGKRITVLSTRHRAPTTSTS